METKEGNISVHSRKWGAISLLENISKRKLSKSKDLEEANLPKRGKTDFFPERKKGRKKYKESAYFIISPESFAKNIWDMLKITLIMIEAALIPYILSFSPHDIQSYQQLIEIIEIIFAIDIVVKFNTEIYFNGLLFSSRLFIAKQYLKNEFLIDIVAIIPFQLILKEVNFNETFLYIHASNTQALKYLWILKLLRLLSAKTIVYSLEDFFVSELLIGPIRAIKFFFGAFIWTHWLACILFAYFARGLEISSVLWKRLLPDPVDNYLRQFYLVLETMTSVGYGDILPVTYSQHIVAIISMCFACVLFGNIIGNIQGYIENYDSEGKYYENNARRLKNYLKRQNLPRALRHKVIQYIYYLKTISSNNNPKELEIIENLSAPLKEEIYILTRGYLLAKSAVFRSYSGSFLKYLGNQMKIEVFAPGDRIFKEGELSNKLYYLSSGKVQIYHEASKTVFKDIKKTKYFGEIAFFLNKPRTASAMCLGFVEFLTLERCCLFNILQSRPKEMEITNVILHHTDKYNNLSLLGIRCYLCRKLGHVAKTCKEFMYIPDKVEVLKRVEAKKYLNQKSVNLNLPSTSNITRQPSSASLLMNYDVYNSHGKPFTPGIKYLKNKRLISRAWSMEGKKALFLKTKQLINITEISQESESDDSIKNSPADTTPITEFNLTFGK